jgi:hypothetical protein
VTLSPRNLMPKAKEFALKALTLDNTLADRSLCAGDDCTLLRLGLVRRRKRIQADNGIPVDWSHRAGQKKRSIAEAKRVLVISPTPWEWDYPIWVFVLARRYDLARERTQELLEVAPNGLGGISRWRRSMNRRRSWRRPLRNP